MHFTAACHCWYCWILTHPLWDGHSYGPGKTGHCFEQKKTDWKQNRFAAFSQNGTSVIGSIPAPGYQVCFLQSFKNWRIFFLGWGGVGGLSCPVKLLACIFFLLLACRPVLNRWLGGFEAESSMKGAHHTAWWDGDWGWQRGWEHAIPEVEISMKWLEISCIWFQWHWVRECACILQMWGSFTCFVSQVWKRHGDMPLLDGSWWF